MTRLSPITRLHAALRKHGPLGAARVLGSRVRERFFPKPVPVHHFDIQHGVDTGGLLWTRKLRSGQANDQHITAYYGTSPSLFRGVIEQWQQTLAATPYQISDFTLIDLGCGKGRVLMMASDLPFRRIVGIELNPDLVATANANLFRWNTSPHACTDITVLCSDVLTALDALTASLSGLPILLYLYNPFDEHVMLPLLEQLSAASRTRTAPIDIIYAHPAHSGLFERIPGMTLPWTGKIPIAVEDTAVDVFNSTGQDVNIYRLAG